MAGGNRVGRRVRPRRKGEFTDLKLDCDEIEAGKVGLDAFIVKWGLNDRATIATIFHKEGAEKRSSNIQP